VCQDDRRAAVASLTTKGHRIAEHSFSRLDGNARTTESLNSARSPKVVRRFERDWPSRDMGFAGAGERLGFAFTDRSEV
jgi:hypothetical protein